MKLAKTHWGLPTTPADIIAAAQPGWVGSTRVKVAVKTQKTCMPGPVAITTPLCSIQP